MARTIPTVPVPTPHLACWPLSFSAETDASDHASAACYRRTKNIRVFAVVVSELKLSNVQRHVFRTDFVERADHAALKDAPKTLNRISVNCADDVLAAVVANDAMRVFVAQLPSRSQIAVA